MATIVLLVVLVVIVLWVIGAYNHLIALKNQVANAWKQIDVQLKRRHDLIPNLVNTVKGAMEFERGTLEAVIAARNKAVGASGVKQTAQAEGELTQALGRLFALTEAYPDLKANQNVLQLQEELTSTENKVGFARQLYNDTATRYNTRQATFPTLLVAGLAKAQPAELGEIEDAAERAVPKVDLSFNKPATGARTPTSSPSRKPIAAAPPGSPSDSSSSSPGWGSAATSPSAFSPPTPLPSRITT